MKCQKCKDDFKEKELEESHDIPKYIGGTDEDGRHSLCKECHSQYDRMILARCFLECFNKLIPYSEDRRVYIPYENKIKNSSALIKAKCFAIAQDCKNEYFNEVKKDDTIST